MKSNPVLRGARLAVAALSLVAAANSSFSQSRVPFHQQHLFLSGSNIAWVNFAGDLGPSPVDTVSFRTVFDSIHAHGGNALRFWLHTTGASTPQFAADGRVTGPGQYAIADLKKILDMAWQRKIGLLLSLWSFDMMVIANGPTVTNRSELMLTDTSYTRSYITNALIPMVSAVRGHPAIIGWEVFNEPEGMSNEFGWSTTYHVPMAAIQTFTNMAAGAIHRTDSAALVTTGAWALTSETDVNGLAKQETAAGRLARMTDAEKENIEKEFAARYGFRQSAAEILSPLAALNMNYYRDDRLIAAGGDPLGTLDFYTVHYYSWQSTPISPFVHPCSVWALTKPLVIAEFFPEQTLALPYTALYDTLYAGGYAGALSWGWYSGASGHSQATLQANTLALVQDLFARYPEDIDADPAAGHIYSFTAAPGTIDSGQSSVLTWKTALGTQATLNGATVPLSGTTTVAPAVTTTYTLAGRGTVADTARVTVTVYPSGRIISFTASATSIGVGDPVVLRWSAAHGSTVSLNDSTVRLSDSLTVRLPATTTFTLRTAGSVRDSASILITAVPQDRIDRALGKQVDVSTSSTNALYASPHNMVDGDTTTAWMSGAGDNQWLICYLGQSLQVKRVIVRWGDNYATSWALQLSPDNSTWSTVRSTAAGTGGVTVADSVNQPAASVALVLNTRASAATGFTIREFEVYGLPQTSSAGGSPGGVPDRYALLPNYPNPFNPSTTITFALPVRSRVTLGIYNLLGQRVAGLFSGEADAGVHTVIWNATRASGVYLCRMEAAGVGAGGGHFTQTIKLMVIR